MFIINSSHTVFGWHGYLPWWKRTHDETKLNTTPPTTSFSLFPSTPFYYKLCGDTSEMHLFDTSACRRNAGVTQQSGPCVIRLIGWAKMESFVPRPGVSLCDRCVPLPEHSLSSSGTSPRPGRRRAPKRKGPHAFLIKADALRWAQMSYGWHSVFLQVIVSLVWYFRKRCNTSSEMFCRIKKEMIGNISSAIFFF